MARSFEPRFMKLGVLTAALQELTPRELRDPDPDRAVEDWLDFARELEADEIQLSAALHPSLADIPEEAMLDPVANTLDLREAFDRKRAERVLAAVKETGVGIADIGYFDNMLHADPKIREAKKEFMLRVFDAAVLLGAPAVCGFVGKAGALLTKIIQAMGLQRDSVYIANILKWRPEHDKPYGNRPPTAEEMNFCLPYLKAQIEIILN